jgi:hypothetical protein
MWLGLVLLLIASAIILVHEGRGTTFWYDEWLWLLERREWSVDAFLEPHNEHFSLVPVAIYKALYAVAGTDDYTPYRLVAVAAHLVVVVLVFVYARRRVGGVLGLLAAALIALLGPAWQNLLWGFQVAWMISLAAGTGAFLALERGDRRGDVTASVLLGVAIASSALGVPVALGMAVDLLWGRRRWRDLWIVAAPIGLYAVWWVAYADSDIVRQAVVLTPVFMANAAAGALASLAGLSQIDLPEEETALAWGRPLAVAAVAVLAWRLATLRPIPARVWALLTVLLSFWLLTGLGRSVIASPDASRYLYVGGLFIVLLATDLARGVALTARMGLVLAAGVAAVTVSNVGVVRDAGRYLRSEADRTLAALGAVELARQDVASEHVVVGVAGYPFVVVTAGPYFEAADDLGSPASSPSEIANAPEDARLVADPELLRVHEVALEPAGTDLPVADEPPTVDAVTGGSASTRGGCLEFRPAAFAPTGVEPGLALTLPPGGVRVSTGDAPATVKLRRFARSYDAPALGTLPASTSATLRIGTDTAPQPWHMSVAAQGRLTVCGLR